MTASPSVAVVGTGRMGAAYAARVAAAGLDLVVHNRTPARAAAVAERLGVPAAPTAREAAASADVVLVSLADDAALRAAYRGPDGIVAGLRPGAVVADTSTVDPATVRELAVDVEAAGAGLVDTPVSGSVATVESGDILVMAGGDRAVLDRARPALDTFARRVLHLGPLGSGATVKLAVNSLLLGLDVALAEALVLAERSGVERAAAYEVFASGAAGAPFVQYKRQAFLEPERTPVAFALDLAAKDLRLVAALADRAGVRLDQLSANRDVVQRAIDAGLGADDLAAIATLLRTS
jgi:3-hydroxyisobutyrate dehydrogenase-like beta-hydroxyacid dehydrogenase